MTGNPEIRKHESKSLGRWVCPGWACSTAGVFPNDHFYEENDDIPLDLGIPDLWTSLDE
jgi:hypothetical protein